MFPGGGLGGPQHFKMASMTRRSPPGHTRYSRVYPVMAGASSCTRMAALAATRSVKTVQGPNINDRRPPDSRPPPGRGDRTLVFAIVYGSSHAVSNATLRSHVGSSFVHLRFCLPLGHICAMDDLVALAAMAAVPAPAVAEGMV